MRAPIFQKGLWRLSPREGEPHIPGEILVQEDLANTFRQVAEGGAEAFYRGDIAKEIVRFSEENRRT